MKRSTAWIVLWLFGLAVGLFLIVRHRPPSRLLNKLWPVPSFELTGVTTKGSAPLHQKGLLGHPWVADFIYTSCGGPCPIMSGKMAVLQRQLPSDVRLVSFSVDPEHDTVPVLEDYAGRFHADPSRWVFARGHEAALSSLVQQGFRLSVTQQLGEPAGTRVFHSTQFVLVDPSGWIRGYYDSNGASFFKDIGRDVRQLMAE